MLVFQNNSIQITQESYQVSVQHFLTDFWENLKLCKIKYMCVAL